MSDNQSNPVSRWLFRGLLLLAALGGFLLAGYLSRDHGAGDNAFQAPPATILPQPRPVGSFLLTDQAGQPFTVERLQGHWSMVFFGYTHCPDICPGTLSMLNLVYRDLPEILRQRLQVILVSVDPERDTVAVLKDYMAYFNPDFIGLTGEQGQVANLARQLGAIYLKVQQPGEADYQMDHSSAVVLINPQGQWYALYSAPHDPQAISLSLQHILEHEEPGP